MSKYLKAAELIENGWGMGACLALMHCGATFQEVQRFEKLYKPTDEEIINLNQKTGNFMVCYTEPSFSEEIKSRRILAMCFMHTLLEAGDLDDL